MLRVDRFMNPISCAGVFFLPGASGTWLPAYPDRPSTRKGSVSSRRQTAHMGSAVARDHPRHFPPLRWRRSKVTTLPDQALVGQPSPDDSTQYGDESPRIGHLACVEAKRLLIKVPEQMEGLDADIGALNALTRGKQSRPPLAWPVLGED